MRPPDPFGARRFFAAAGICFCLAFASVVAQAAAAVAASSGPRPTQLPESGAAAPIDEAPCVDCCVSPAALQLCASDGSGRAPAPPHWRVNAPALQEQRWVNRRPPWRLRPLRIVFCRWLD